MFMIAAAATAWRSLTTKHEEIADKHVGVDYRLLTSWVPASVMSISNSPCTPMETSSTLCVPLCGLRAALEVRSSQMEEAMVQSL